MGLVGREGRENVEGRETAVQSDQGRVEKSNASPATARATARDTTASKVIDRITTHAQKLIKIKIITTPGTKG